MIHNHSQQIFSRASQQIFSADLLSRFSQQIFSANLLSRSSQQIFSCCGQGLVVSYCLIILVVYTQQISAADFLSKSSQQIFSADLLSRSSQQIFSADHLLWSGVGGQLLSYHLPCHLLWSGVGGQLLSYHFGGLYCMSSLEGPFRGAFGKSCLLAWEGTQP